ncbi:MAG TPA: hypothetical protein VGB98_14370 [Pyrinomonadaceae bacterium]|jgi:hypothetical protein
MHKSIKALLLFTIVFTVCVVVMGLRIPDLAVRSNHHQQSTVDVDESQFPVAEEAAPEPSTTAERTKKADKEKKYRKYKDTIGPGVTVASIHYHWPPGFPTLPVAQSDAVVIGDVAGAKAHVSADKATVYSEFTVRVIKVLKDDKRIPLSPGASIVAERPGGRVRYPSGHISRFSLTGWGMPRIMRQYVLFLTGNNEDQTYRLVTGYELCNGQIAPLDRTTSSDTDFDAYINMDEAEFLKRLDSAIALSSSAGPR